MLTNLSWLAEGKLFPPPSEKERMQLYENNEKLLLSKHRKVYEEHFEELARRLKKKIFEVDVIVNYQQLLSKKIADLVCGEPPTIETEQDTDTLDTVLEQIKWHVKLYEAVIDVTCFGNAILKFVGKKVTAVSPKCWFPIVDKSDIKEIIQHVIAYPITPDNNGDMTKIYVEIHDVGRIETRIYNYDAKKCEIGSLKESKVEKTNLEISAVQVLTNITCSSSLYGIDDYSVVNSIVAKIMWRLYCIDNVLDKHSDPSISGPKSALTFDERTGRYFLDLGKYFSRDVATDPDVKYITWDGNLESSFKELETLFNQLYILSEMGQAFAEGGGGGNASSGTALKLKMVSPRVKAARIANINTSTIKQIIITLAKLNGVELKYDGLTLHWNDGLPIDESEQFTNLTTATGGKPIMSQYAALKRMGLSDKEVKAELEQMQEESSATAPVMLSTIDKQTTNNPDESGVV